MQQTKCLQAKMFGGLQIQVGDRYLVEKGGRVNKPIELLVYLLLNRGTQITNEQIMEALWGDDEVENPAGALKNAAYSLRRQLTKAGPGAGVHHHPGTAVRLEPGRAGGPGRGPVQSSV